MRLLVVALVGVVGVSIAGATAYVDEDFEGSFPPPEWTVAVSGANAGWDDVAGGPTGVYAKGWAFSMNGTENWAQLNTSPFRVPANSTVEFRYDYKYYYGGLPASNYAKFSLFYVGPPEQVIGSVRAGVTSTWRSAEGEFNVPGAGSIKARFEVWVKNPTSHSSIYTWDVDNVQINDKGYHAVVPNSLGRVKALFR